MSSINVKEVFALLEGEFMSKIKESYADEYENFMKMFKPVDVEGKEEETKESIFTEGEKAKIIKKMTKMMPQKNKNKGTVGRPKNSWMLFLDEYRKKNKENGVSGKEIVKQASIEWNMDKTLKSDISKIETEMEGMAEGEKKDMKKKLEEKKKKLEENQKYKAQFDEKAKTLMAAFHKNNVEKLKEQQDNEEKSEEKSEDNEEKPKKETKPKKEKPKKEVKEAKKPKKSAKEEINKELWDNLNPADFTRIVCEDEKSSKFWEYLKINEMVLVRYGKQGSKGTMMQKTFENEGEADKYINKERQVKEKKGYK